MSNLFEGFSFRQQDLSEAAYDLESLMSDLSQDCNYAGWSGGLEYDLWGFVQHGPGRYGAGHVTQANVDELKALSEKAGGWWVYYGFDQLFLSLEQWEAYRADETVLAPVAAAQPKPEYVYITFSMDADVKVKGNFELPKS